MRQITVDMVYILNGKVLDSEAAFEADEAGDIAFKMKSGTIINRFVGCDHRENPASIVAKLAKKVKKGEQIVEMFDGSDHQWYGILPGSKRK